MIEVTDVDIVLDALCNASASGMSISDCVRLLEDADCLLCWNNTVNLYGMEGISVDEYQFQVVSGEIRLKRK